MPRCMVGSRQAEHRRVDGRGRYGKEYGNSLVQRERERERRTDEEGRAASPREL